MMLDLAAGKLDVAKLDEGCWWTVRVEDGAFVGEPVDQPAPDQPAVLLVPLGVGYDRQHALEREEYVEDIRKGVSDAEEDRLRSLIAGRAAAKKVVRGWQNLTVGGEPVEWSEAKALEILTGRAWRGFLDFCLSAASQRRAVLQREEAQAQGNS